MKKFAFVILNYMTFDETEKCVDSIKQKCSNHDYNIIIVDNNSPDKSGKKLYDKYDKDHNIDVILNKDNLGFARGNNIGFNKAKYDYKSDFIILCNSDTIILDDDFCDKIIKKYELDNYAVLGPKEILPDGSNYPLNNNYPTIKRTKKYIKLFTKRLLANRSILYSIIFFIENNISKILGKIMEKKQNEKLDVNKEYKNIILHGFFLIFSKEYIDKFDGLDDRTYFYEEESLLAIRLKNNNLTSIYYPEIKIFHNKNSATNKRTKNKKAKEKFIYENEINSLKIVLEELNSEK